jgi:hypothetical protein
MPRTKTSFGPDNPPPKSPGRPRLTDEAKRKARLQRAVDYDFKQECRAMLPIATDQLLDELAKGNLRKKGELLRTVEVLRDSVHGKPAQAITGPDGGPLAFTFAQLVASVDGGKKEKI